MPATRYKIWSVGPPVGQGVTKSLHVGVSGIAKGRAENQPYVVANELICGHLAKALLLPVPPGFIIEHDGGPHFVSLNFNLAGEDLPPVDPAVVARDHAELACGIVLFDAWIVNPDRHPRNIAHDTDSNRVQIFDHSHALFGPGKGRQQLEAAECVLGIGRHCLVRELTDLQAVPDWHAKILAVPEFYVREVVEAAAKVGLQPDDVRFCSDFLLSRRKKLVDLIRDHRKAFPKVSAKLWDDLASSCCMGRVFALARAIRAVLPGRSAAWHGRFCAVGKQFS